MGGGWGFRGASGAFEGRGISQDIYIDSFFWKGVGAGSGFVSRGVKGFLILTPRIPLCPGGESL